VAPPRRKTLTDQDRSEWAAYVRHVAPLAGRAMPEMPPAAAVTSEPAPRTPRADAVPPRAPRAVPATLSVGTHPGGLDNGSWNRFRTGKLAPMRTLDLHGRTAQRAFHALHAFLLAAHADHVRVVEVITGRGSGEAGGVLRRELPLWLNLPDLRPLVLAASHPHAANNGSVRLLLRRPKP
jgi:DNA-nicking Smr family endonuclease